MRSNVKHLYKFFYCTMCSIQYRSFFGFRSEIPSTKNFVKLQSSQIMKIWLGQSFSCSSVHIIKTFSWLRFIHCHCKKCSVIQTVIGYKIHDSLNFQFEERSGTTEKDMLASILLPQYQSNRTRGDSESVQLASQSEEQTSSVQRCTSRAT